MDERFLVRILTLVRGRQEGLSVIRRLWNVSIWHRYFRKAIPNCHRRWQM